MTDDELADEVAGIANRAGQALLDRFDPAARPADLDGVWAALRGNDEASLAVLRPALEALRPGAGWLEEVETELPPHGEWWIVDPSEGNINHVHGLPDWCVSVTLLRDGAPVVTALSFPLAGRTVMAARGAGARVDGRRLRVSGKTDLAAAFVTTSQAAPDEDPAVLTRASRAVDAMLHAALLVRMAVPATVQLLAVAEGHVDLFWQPSAMISGLAAGALLVTEAGGVVTDAAGRPWAPGATELVAGNPTLAARARPVLAAAWTDAPVVAVR